MDPIRELPYGPAACDSRNRGRTHVSTRPRSALFEKILLAPTGASTHVHDDDVAVPQDRNEFLLDIGAKAFAVDGTVEDARCGELVAAQRAQEGQCAPVTMRSKAAQPLPLRTPAAQGRHVGLYPGLVDEDEAGGIEAALPGLPAPTPAGDVGPALLKGEQRFF